MDSTQELIQTIRARLLDFAPASGSTLRVELGGGASARLYTDGAPDGTTYPYAVLRLADHRQTDGYGGFRKTVELEVQVYDRPRSQVWRAQRIADVIEQALLLWETAADGLVFSRHVRRVGPLPPAPDPMDRELVQIAVFAPVVVWPVMLSQYVT